MARVLRLTPSVGDYNGLDLIGSAGTGPVVARPFSLGGETDLDLYLFGLGSGMVYLNGALPELTGSRGLAAGYCPLDATTRVPLANLGTGTATGTKFLRDDRVWAVPNGGGIAGPTGLDGQDSEDPPSRPPGNMRLDQLGHATPTIGGPDGVAQRLVTYQTRQPRYWLKNPAATSFTSVGMIAAPTVTSFAAGGTTGDTATRPYLTINTTAIIDQEASIVSTTAFLRRAFLPTLVVPIHAGDAASQSNIRRWIGFWSTALAAVSTPTTQRVAAFRYDTALDGTAFWRCVTCDGASNVTTTTTTIAADTTSAERIFRIEMNGSLGQISFYIDDVCVALHSTNLPGNTSSMIVGASMTTLTAAARNMRVGSLTLIHT